MSWETRNGRSYYYEERKVAGRVVKRYVGPASKPWVQAAAGLDRLDAQHKQDEARDKRRQIAPFVRDLEAASAHVSAYDAALKPIIDSAATAGGYHRHNRGGWRKRRMAGKIETLTREKKQAAIDLLETLSGNPPTYAYHDVAGMMKYRALIIDCLAKGLCGKSDGPAWEGIVSEIANIEATVAGVNASPLEQLLAERVAIGYAHVMYAEKYYQVALLAGLPQQDKHIFTEHIDSAQRRYLAAIKTLAQVRRMQLPTVQIGLPGAVQVGQVNVGDKQINVATQASPAS